MRKNAQLPTGGIYRTRNPQVGPLCQCVRRHSCEPDAAGLVAERFKGQRRPAVPVRSPTARSVAPSVRPDRTRSRLTGSTTTWTRTLPVRDSY